MKELSQIVQIIDKNKPKKVEVLGNADAQSRHAELYTLIKDGHIATDEDAERFFYNASKAESTSAYRQFKSRFRERLMNTLFFIDNDNAEAGDLQNATLYVHKEWAAINIIYTKGDFGLASKLAEKLLPFAIKYELTEIVIYIADRLRQGYGTQIANRNRYLELKKLQDTYMELWQREILSRELFHDIRMDYIKSSASQANTVEKARNSWLLLQPYLAQNASYQFITHTYAIGLAQYSTKLEELQTAIQLCDEAIAVLSKKPFTPKKSIAVFMNQKIACYAQLKEQTAGEEMVKEALALQDEGSSGWFKTLENQTLLAFHTRKYDKVLEILQRVQSHKSYKTLTLQHYEIWQLFNAYVHFLAISGKIEAQEMKNSKFKASKFINDIPTFSTDKEGMNVSALIIQIAILIAEKKFTPIPDRLDALSKYWRRHIRKTEAIYRSHCFIKMLQELPKGNYKRLRVEPRTKLMLNDLTAVPLDTKTQDYKSEIIPLEDLWEILMTLM
jgi:hypothetical protein